MILDKLMEKKDLRIYIKVRKAEIRRLKREEIMKFPPREREQFRQRMIGRLKELDKLNDVLAQDNLKEANLALWAKNWKEVVTPPLATGSATAVARPEKDLPEVARARNDLQG